VEGLTGTLRIHWSPPAEPAWSRADRTLLRQALGNILKNAAEAAGNNGQVWIGLDETPGRVRIIIEDDGPGWPSGARETMLEPYFTTKEQGTGLGLSLVQRTMLQHGGSMELQDRPGGGARVVLMLPAARGGSDPDGATGRSEAS
jgi:nitrogen fixation/metabolism regulation signal transduction histidine kinase